MKAFSFFVLATALAAPAYRAAAVNETDTEEVSYTWDKVWNPKFEIHSSCNATQTNQLLQALEETTELAQHAKEHTLRYGNLSAFYRKYFGDAPPGEVIGIYEEVVSANKTGVLFRCDDIDGNCKFDKWAGHWRGSNATDETVICDYSYVSRLFLSQMCGLGYTVAASSNTRFWASDLLHRIWHTDKLGHGVVGHYADTYDECLELAEKNATYALRNSASLRYFALDVWAYDIAVPGVGCTGGETTSASSTTTSTTTSSTKSTSPTATATTESTEKADHDDEESSSGENCHTHADGEIHCVK